MDLTGARPVDAALLRRLNEAQVHRGPDEDGLHQEPGLGFGHKRLSIIDLATGQQPMSTPDGQVTVVFNGEIYNYQDVRARLIEDGYRFRTNCDTEVILYAWMEWGEACVNQFRGMFAFALWDRRTATLFLARDRLGVKPLHYAITPDGWLVFASELKGVLAHPAVQRTLDPQAIEDFFAYGYIPDPRTIFKGVRKLAAAHTLMVRRGQPIGLPKPYWDVVFSPRHTGSEADLAAELIDRFREAVRIRLISEVPLGAFLSGGVDSSGVVAMMAGLLAEPVNTCSIGFDVPDVDETAYANEIAKRYHTRHRSRIVAADDFSVLDRLIHAYDEPFADASALPTYRVCQLARESVTVALSGDGGDELFAGYRRHRLHANEERLRAALPLGLRRSLFGPLGRLFPKLDWAPQMFRAKTTFQSLGMTTDEAYFHSVSAMSDAQRQRLFSPAFRRELQGYRASELLTEVMRRAPAEDVLGQAQYADIKVWLPGDILTKMDRASMAVGLEAREPLLDHELLEWAAGLPMEMRLQGGEGKYLLKRALEPMVPADILYRPKQGFMVPLDAWFRGALREEALGLPTQPLVQQTGWFNTAEIAQAIDDHVSGVRNNGRFIWQMTMLTRSLSALLTDLPSPTRPASGVA
jgi:asparagine synthase (glutamine-hydrolysing)